MTEQEEQEEQELAELISEVIENIQVQAETLEEVVEKVIALTDRLTRIEEQLKKLEADTNGDKISSPWIPTPVNPWPFTPAPSPAPIWPAPSPWPSPAPIWPDQTNPTYRCAVCGVNQDNGGGWGYACGRTGCPSGVYSLRSASPTTIASMEAGDTTCECGQNSSCQCSK